MTHAQELIHVKIFMASLIWMVVSYAFGFVLIEHRLYWWERNHGKYWIMVISPTMLFLIYAFLGIVFYL